MKYHLKLGRGQSTWDADDILRALVVGWWIYRRGKNANARRPSDQACQGRLQCQPEEIGQQDPSRFEALTRVVQNSDNSK